MCGKRFVVFIRETIACLALNKEYAITDTVRAELTAISPVTIDRLLAKEKQLYAGSFNQDQKQLTNKVVLHAATSLAWND